MPDDGPTYLYRFFDVNNRLLYVGISLSPMARTIAHRTISGWFDAATLMELKQFPTRREAADAEAVAIREEKPLHNKRTRSRSLRSQRDNEGPDTREMRSIRLSDSEWLAFQQVAGLMGMRVAVWMRMQLRLVAAGQLSRAHLPVPFLISEESRP